MQRGACLSGSSLVLFCNTMTGTAMHENSVSEETRGLSAIWSAHRREVLVKALMLQAQTAQAQKDVNLQVQ